MDLKTYFEADPGARKALAADIGTDAEYLWQLATRWNKRQPSPAMALRIEQGTGGKVTRADLRPDIWGSTPKRKKAA